ncbi:hypothetical protein EVAR_91569_1 [Eumeta japonica]|uniref:Uncharacterized protein n=1 Tax=Eumeta variegata TaxID=151549 RepID=A0A4C1XDA7_EUMVA|nr:hypothetical protein EVAR_91569_1 [Eumeta japonica]
MLMGYSRDMEVVVRYTGRSRKVTLKCYIQDPDEVPFSANLHCRFVNESCSGPPSPPAPHDPHPSAPSPSPSVHYLVHQISYSFPRGRRRNGDSSGVCLWAAMNT